MLPFVARRSFVAIICHMLLSPLDGRGDGDAECDAELF